MKTTKLTFVMATICLNFSYGQIKEKSPAQNQLQLYQYGFCGFKSGYKPGFKIKKEVANRGKTPSLFAIIPLSSSLPSLMELAHPSAKNRSLLR